MNVSRLSINSRAARTEYEAHAMLCDSVGETGAMAAAWRAIKPAPVRKPAPRTFSLALGRLRMFFSVRTVRA